MTRLPVTDAELHAHVDGVLFDLTGADPQRRAPVNATYAQTFSACAYALKCLIDQDIPTNHGFYELVRLIAPPGTVVNCTAPAPVVGGWETQTRLTDIIFAALAPALPDRLPAGTKAMMCQAGFGGIDPATGDYYCFYEAIAGGYGGAHYARRLDPRRVRSFVIVVGFAMTLYFFLRR